MATVGLSFGSATSGQGFDVAGTVTQILAAAGAIEIPWKTQSTALAAQDSALTGLGTDLSALTTKLQALTDFSGVLAQKQGSSSQPNVLSLSAAGPASVAGSHTIVVTSLAQTASDYSSVVTAPGNILSGGFTVQVGNGTVHTVTAGSGSNTLASLAGAINAAGIGVLASIVSDAAGSRLSLVSSVSGSAGQLTVTSTLQDTTAGTAIGFQTGQLGANAALSVDGIALSSARNTVTDAIPGVTFQLLASAPAAPVQVQITNDTNAVATAVSDFVSAYNKVQADLTTQEGKDASGQAEPLFGNSTLALIQTQLSGALLSGQPSGSVAGIAQLGISLQTDGSIKLSTNDLLAALNSNFADITGFFQNASSFGAVLNTALNGLGTQNPSGLVSLALQQNSSEEASLTKNVSDEDARLATEKTGLTAELNAANQILQSIPAQLLQVNEIYSAVTGFNTTQGG